MNYILDGRYRLRGWLDRPCGVCEAVDREVRFLPREAFLALMKCDGAHDLDDGSLTEAQRRFLETARGEGVVRPAGFMEVLDPQQAYRRYPAAYRESAHWSITGACNLKCRHCFMSAPHARHGAPSHEQILNIADQLAECGVFKVGLTGGEPLIREDFLDIVSALTERQIAVTTLYTNGWLVDEQLLDALEARGQRPSFQLSYDGVGMHDFLRGVPGAEARTIRALELLQARGIPVSVSMCVHRKNAHTLRDSVRLLASLGVGSLKAGPMMQLGEWAQPEVADLQLTSPGKPGGD